MVYMDNSDMDLRDAIQPRSLLTAYAYTHAPNINNKKRQRYLEDYGSLANLWNENFHKFGDFGICVFFYSLVGCGYIFISVAALRHGFRRGTFYILFLRYWHHLLHLLLFSFYVSDRRFRSLNTKLHVKNWENAQAHSVVFGVHIPHTTVFRSHTMHNALIHTKVYAMDLITSSLSPFISF